MGQNFIACDRDQVLLLAPDLRDWLPAGHLARFVIETVDALDLDAFYGYYRQDGKGRPAHDPAMMVTLAFYAYAIGVTSSREIERRCVDDVAFRVISVNQQPDHSTVARFLVRHRDALSELFGQVLVLCQRAGMVRVGTVAVDSTKLAANASLDQNRTFEGLRAEAERIIDAAIETDRREDELYGDRRGDELPLELADPRTRKARIKELLEEARRERERLESEREEKIVAEGDQLAQTGKRRRGRPTRDVPSRKQQQFFAQKYNVTDPDSGIVRHRGMLMQGYNVHTVASEDQVILVTAVKSCSSDGGQLEPMVRHAEVTLTRVGLSGLIEEVLADTGYWQGAQVRALKERGLRVLVPPYERGTRSGPEVTEARRELQTPDGRLRYARRKQIIEPVFARMKYHRGITRLYRRGKAAVQAEVDLIATTHNLLKLRATLQIA